MYVYASCPEEAQAPGARLLAQPTSGSVEVKGVGSFSVAGKMLWGYHKGAIIDRGL